MEIPRIPLGEYVERAVEVLDANLQFLFTAVTDVLGFILTNLQALFSSGPPWIWVLLLSLLAWRLAGWQVALFSIIGLGFIVNVGLWGPAVTTIALVLTAELIILVVGIPIGILAGRNDSVHGALRPVLDFLQTMPAFVYLIPAIMFLGLGMVPGVVATFIFAIAPLVRLTDLGIRQVPRDLIDASDAFGATELQKLFKVQLPVARTTIMAGVNQSIMLSLSMVVIAAMIGAGGLGSEVLRAIQRVNIGNGFEAGLAVVILAIYFDRLTATLGAKKDG
jgi:glycine betaine/proline transport system permease protein